MSLPPPLPIQQTTCARCGAPLADDDLACPRCGQFVRAARLAKLSSEALGLEPINPLAAATLWQQCLDLLPPDVPQRNAVRQRIDALASGLMPPRPLAAQNPDAPVLDYRPRQPKEDPLPIAVSKTVVSMAISIAVYTLLFHNFAFAALFVVLMLVHEMGHVIANRYYGLSASPPIFIPFLGAVINLRQPPPNAKAEAIVGIGGPILGTVGSIVAYWYALHSGSEILFLAAHFGFLLNLFNLLPVPPLDGGRVTAAVSPWIWTLGLAGLAWMFIADWRNGHHIDYILILVLIYAFPRIQATLRGRERFSEYYRITRVASWSIAAVYLLLGIALIYFYQTTKLPGMNGF